MCEAVGIVGYLSSGHGRALSVWPLYPKVGGWWCDGAVLCPMAARSLRRGESHFCFHPQIPQKPSSPLRLKEPRDDTARLLRTHTRLGVTRSLTEAPFANTTDVPLELNAFLSLSPSEKRPYVTMILFSSRSVLLSVYYPQIFLILTSGSYL